MASIYTDRLTYLSRQQIHNQLMQNMDNYNNQLAQAQQAYNQSNYAQQQANYPQALASTTPQLSQPAQYIEKVKLKEERTPFNLRRFIDKLIHLPIALIDRLAT